MFVKSWLVPFSRVESKSLLFNRQLDHKVGSDRRFHGENSVEDQGYETIAVLLRDLREHRQNGRSFQNGNEQESFRSEENLLACFLIY